MAIMAQMMWSLSYGDEGEKTDYDRCRHPHQIRVDSHDGQMTTDSRNNPICLYAGSTIKTIMPRTRR
jgi:hypothetical protein